MCPLKIYRHGASQVSTKMRDLAIFWWDRQYFLLDYQAKSWMVGRYATVCCYHPAHVTNTLPPLSVATTQHTVPIHYHHCLLLPTSIRYHHCLLSPCIQHSLHTTQKAPHSSHTDFLLLSNPHTPTVVYANKLTYSCMGKSLCMFYVYSAVTIRSRLFGQAGIPLILLLVTLG